jgi:hypothetical protein
MTSLRQCGEQLLAVPQVGRHLFDEGVCRHEFLQRHHDRELGDQFVAANAAEIESGVAVTGALALDDAVDEILRRPEEIGHSHSQRHDCFCPSQRNNHFGMPKTERKLNVGFLTQVSRCFVLGTAQLSENLLARRIPLAASQLPALRRWPFLSGEHGRRVRGNVPRRPLSHRSGQSEFKWGSHGKDCDRHPHCAGRWPAVRFVLDGALHAVHRGFSRAG